MTKSIYPPNPAFPSPNARARAQMLGTFKYQALKDGSIKILDDWAQRNLVKVFIPQLAHVENAPKDCKVVFHRAGAKQLQSLFAAWERAGLIRLVKTWAGTFAPRMIRGSHTNLSNHAYASAFDINAAWNGLGHQPATGDGTVLPLVPLANAHGFFWGGHYGNRLDGMHFELAVLNMFPKTLIATSVAAGGGALINQKTEVYPANVASKINSISAAPVAAETNNAAPVGALQQTAGNPPEAQPKQKAENSSAQIQPTTEICKERPSAFVRLWTAIVAGVGSFTALGVNVQSLFEKATDAISAKQILWLIIGACIVGAAFWFYDRSAKRANVLNQQKLAIASNPGLINTELNANK